MAWKIEYTASARRQLRQLDKSSARRILDYMDQRVAPLEDARSLGKALRGPLGEFWRYRVGDFRIICQFHQERMQVLVVRLGDREDVYRYHGEMQTEKLRAGFYGAASPPSAGASGNRVASVIIWRS